MTCAPVVHLAIDFDISSEMIAPVKPTTAENTSRPPYDMPACEYIALVEAEELQHDRQHEHHGEVGDDEEDDAFHAEPPGRCAGRMVSQPGLRRWVRRRPASRGGRLGYPVDLLQESLSVTARLHTGLPGAWSARSATK